MIQVYSCIVVLSHDPSALLCIFVTPMDPSALACFINCILRRTKSGCMSVFGLWECTWIVTHRRLRKTHLDGSITFSIAVHTGAWQEDHLYSRFTYYTRVHIIKGFVFCPGRVYAHIRTNQVLCRDLLIQPHADYCTYWQWVQTILL